VPSEIEVHSQKPADLKKRSYRFFKVERNDVILQNTPFSGSIYICFRLSIFLSSGDRKNSLLPIMFIIIIMRKREGKVEEADGMYTFNQERERKEEENEQVQIMREE
jgi:hypothetical protein